MRPNARIRETFLTQYTVYPLLDSWTNSKDCLKEVFTALGVFGSKLVSGSVLPQKIMIEHLWVSETNARIRVSLLARALQG